MTVTIKADPVGFGDMEMSERQGARNHLTRHLLATGISETGAAAVDEVMDALNTDYPAWHSPSTSTNLVCVGRQVRIMAAENKPSMAVVTLEYASRGEAEPDYLISGTGSLRQITSEKDFFGVPLAVSYTFPVDYPHNTDLQGVTDTQGAEINVNYPNQVLRGTRYLQVSNPILFISLRLDRVNSKLWLGMGPGVALCTDITYNMHDYSTSPKKWKFSFEFLLDGAGHQPDVIYRDPNTGSPPSDLVQGVGYYTASWYPGFDFNELFPTP